MMPFSQRASYAFAIALVLFAGFAVCCSTWLAIEMFANPVAGDRGKFSVGELLTIIALLTCVMGTIAASGAVVGGLFASVVPTSRWFWFGVFVTGLFNAGLFLTLTFLTEHVLGVAMIGPLTAMGFASAVLMRPIGLCLALARRYYPPGRCLGCGYDLSHTPVGCECPECGAIKPQTRESVSN